MKTNTQIKKRLNELFTKHEQANFRQSPMIGKLINELEWVLGEELTDFA